MLPLPGQKNLQNQIQFRIWQTLPVKPIFQSTLPQRERLFNFARGSESPFISIHAPAKGATTGITLLMYFTVFQSSLPRRKRLNRCKDVQKAYGISILAPAKGATTATVRLKRWHRHFNPRSRKGSDLPQKRKRRYIRIFQSTLPRRERLQSQRIWETQHFISIHAPAKGATAYIPLFLVYMQLFQSTLPRRERLSNGAATITHTISISIHAPAKGATAQPKDQPITKTVFQSTLPRRERLDENGNVIPPIPISIHAPAKGATTLPGTQSM